LAFIFYMWRIMFAARIGDCIPGMGIRLSEFKNLSRLLLAMFNLSCSGMSRLYDDQSGESESFQFTSRSLKAFKEVCDQENSECSMANGP